LTTIFPNLAYAKLPQLYGRPLLHLWLLKFAQLLFEQRNIDGMGNVYENLSERTNIVVVADEAHRSQYGFKGRVVTTKEDSEIAYFLI
jgi:hypothetical protein